VAYVSDAWQSYLEMAMGLTKASRKKAEKAVKELVGKGNAKAGELQTMAESLVAAGLSNREALTKLVDAEIEKALGRVGLVKSDEVTALQRRVAELEQRLAARDEHGPAAAPLAAPVNATPVTPPVVKKIVAKKTVAKAPALSSGTPTAAPVTAASATAAPTTAAPTTAAPAVKKAPAAKPAPTQKTAKKAPVKKAPAAKAPAKKAPAKKATASE